MVWVIHCKKIIVTYFKLQSNLCTTTTLGTGKKWSLLTGGRYWEVVVNKGLTVFAT